MKKATANLVGVMVALLLSGSAFAQTKVTFNVNAALYPDTLRPNHLVQIRGAVDGAGSTTPAITWDAASATATSAGGDYWTVTLTAAPGTKLNYKFWAGRNATTPLQNKGTFGGSAYTEEGWEGGGNRTITFPTTDTTVNVWIGHTSNVRPYRIPAADSAAVMFRVNVGSRVQAGLVVPGTTGVEVRGGTAPLTWGGDTGVKLTAEPFIKGDNHMYRGVAYFKKDAAASVFYKFFAQDWESNAVGENGSDNRNFRVRRDTTLHFKFFNNEVPTAAQIVTAQVTFAVNTGYMQLLGLYSESAGTRGDRVVIRGGGAFGGWASSADDGNKGTLRDSDKYYVLNKEIRGPVGQETGYKWYIDYDASRLTEGGPNFLPAYFADQGGFGYEEPLSTGGGNRIFKQETATVRVEPKVNFNDVSTSAVILKNKVVGGTGPMRIVFRVDMTNAMARRTSGRDTTRMVAGDSVFFSLESKLTALTLGMRQIINRNLARQYVMTREGTTNIYSYTLTVNADATLNDFGFNVWFGKPGVAEANWVGSGNGTFDAGRRYIQFVKPANIQASVDDPVLGTFFPTTWPVEAVLPVVQWTNGSAPAQTPIVYDPVSNEGSGRVAGYELMANYPNPFNPSTTIQFRSPVAGRVTLEVFNVLGQKVATLMNNELVAAGMHTRAFDASTLSSGMYIYRVSANGFTAQRKMMLVK